MNHNLKSFARQYLKENLSKCSEKEQELFKRMYGRKPNNIKETLDSSIERIVDEMEDGKLDWAMTQVENTLKKKQSNI